MGIKLRKEMLVAVLFLLPYLENNFTQKYLQFYFDNSYIRAITVVSSIVMVIVLVGIVLKNKLKIDKSIRTIRGLLLSFVLYSGLSSMLITKDSTVSLCVWIWCATPILFALLVIYYFDVSELKLTRLIKYGILWFAIYLFIVLVYYIVVHHLFFDSTVRMKPRGGGAVIFGYTIALFFSLTLIYKNEFNRVGYYGLLVLFSIGALGTTTRGAVWLIVLLWVANFLFVSFSSKRILFFLFLIPVVFFVCSIDFTSLETTTFVGFGRLLNLHSFRRDTSTDGLIEVFKIIPLQQKLVGTGLGGFFPYQQWSIFNGDVENNMFTYMGQSILVQPHNSFLYMLMESGLCGTTLVVAALMKGLGKCIKKKSNRWLFRVIFIGAFIVLNCLDSVFFVQPGTAYLFWLLFFLMLEDNEKNSMEKKRNQAITALRGLL